MCQPIMRSVIRFLLLLSYVEVYLGRTLNPKLLPMSLCKMHICVCVFKWMNEKQRKVL